MNEKFYFDNFEIDTLKRCLLRGGSLVPLDPKAFDLLVALVNRRGDTVSKRELLDEVWTNQFVEEKNLTVHVTAIRRALGDTDKERRFIITVPGNGYKFVAELCNGAGTANGTPHIHVSPTPGNGSRPISRPFFANKARGVVLGVAALVLLFAAVGLIYFRRGLSRTGVLAAPISQNLSFKRLTTDGKISGAAMGPDGKLFAYSHLDGEDQSLWLGHINGGEPIMIRPPAPVVYTNLVFSPDANNLYYSLVDERTNNGSVYRIPVFGGLPEKIADLNSSIAFSPDGRQFAYVKNNRGANPSELAISDADGRNEKVVAVSPEGMKFTARGISWAPDGSKIAAVVSYSEGGSAFDLVTVEIGSGRLQPLTKNHWSRLASVSWLSDENGLIIAAQKEDSTRNWLWQVSYPDGEVRRLISDLNVYGSNITHGSDQNSLLIIQTQLQSNVWVAPVEDLARSQQITFSSFGRMDGWYGLKWITKDKLAYTAEGEENNTIWTMNPGGGEQKQLIPSDGNNIYPSYTADDRYVVFQSNRSGNIAIWRAASDGTDLVRLTDNDVAAQPDVSSDGRWVVYITSLESSGELWRTTISGDDPVKLADHASWPRVSPDSRFVASEYIVDGQSKLAVFPIDGGAPVQLFNVPRLANLRYGVRWTADGKTLTYRDWANGLWRQELSGGSPQRIKGLPNEKIYAYDWSPDGKYLAYTRGTEMKDVVLINGAP